MKCKTCRKMQNKNPIKTTSIAQNTFSFYGTSHKKTGKGVTLHIRIPCCIICVLACYRNASVTSTFACMKYDKWTNAAPVRRYDINRLRSTISTIWMPKMFAKNRRNHVKNGMFLLWSTSVCMSSDNTWPRVTPFSCFVFFFIFAMIESYSLIIIIAFIYLLIFLLLLLFPWVKCRFWHGIKKSFGAITIRTHCTTHYIVIRNVFMSICLTLTHKTQLDLTP